MRTPHTIAVTALISLVLTFANFPAWADPWPSHSFNHPDGGNHAHCFATGNWEPIGAVRDKMQESINYMDNNTQATKSYNDPCVTSGNETDVVWRGGRVECNGIEVIGCASCVSSNSNGNCDRFRATVNGPLIREHYSDDVRRERQYRKTSCHELGHTLGLDHYSTMGDRFPDGLPHQSGDPYELSCQRSGWVGGQTDAWIRQWEAHHIGHINDWF